MPTAAGGSALGYNADPDLAITRMGLGAGDCVVLVGDLPYFSRVGFANAPDVRLPGPVDPRRVLSRSFDDAAPAGMIGPR